MAKLPPPPFFTLRGHENVITALHFTEEIDDSISSKPSLISGSQTDSDYEGVDNENSGSDSSVCNLIEDDCSLLRQCTLCAPVKAILELVIEDSYQISLFVAKTGKNHIIEENLIKPSISAFLKTVLEKDVKVMPLSKNTVSGRIDEMGEDIEEQLVEKLRKQDNSQCKWMNQLSEITVSIGFLPTSDELKCEIFSNESQFSLNHDDQCIRVWRRSGHQPDLAFVVERHTTITYGVTAICWDT
ncbi:SCAN domain-containing protein 3 [Trichonephila clavipes]|nr:SCAN domain-containing protein 3 [Trichonephila clavipes]